MVVFVVFAVFVAIVFLRLAAMMSDRGDKSKRAKLSIVEWWQAKQSKRPAPKATNGVVELEAAVATTHTDRSSDAIPIAPHDANRQLYAAGEAASANAAIVSPGLARGEEVKRARPIDPDSVQDVLAPSMLNKEAGSAPPDTLLEESIPEKSCKSLCAPLACACHGVCTCACHEGFLCSQTWCRCLAGCCGPNQRFFFCRLHLDRLHGGKL
jgi:hypothetical protein